MRIRILLEGAADEELVRRAMYAADLNVVDEIEPGDDHPYEVVFAAPGDEAVAHYVEDDFLGYRYVVVASGDEGVAEEVAGELRGALPHVSRDEVLRRAREARDGPAHAAALYQAAIVAPEVADAELLPLFERAFASGDPGLREAAILAAGYAEWKELAAPLRRLAASDPEPELRAQAAAMQEGLERVWSGRAP